MSRTKEQQQGLDFEDYVAKVLDGKTTPGSGNQFYSKSDVLAHGLLISCKSSGSKLFSNMIKNWLNEAIDYSQGTGSIPALAIEDKNVNEQLIVMRLSDLVKAFQGGVTNIPEHHDSKGIKKRNEADIPVMLRNENLLCTRKP